ncbi:hypothetical protein NLJ89_g2698 [Agrocybe chaxingu]|uniref:NADH:flavin oxidoreductase/NADH oxidase N-terminal domain-containing protein n=1 Tax=Agrocybe chaxingu TaxID=84603 RepID=A0A9W8MXG8_9AGAR|nr:hypothetical protein NLJ89_g2698 [Agrocybe chaxingu]
MSTPALFQPIQVGSSTLQHRVVLAPLTRYKATPKEHVPIVPLVKKYYSQRGSRPGTLLVTEATFIAARAGGYDNVPGIWSDDQIAAWKEVTNGVHEQGSFIYLQLWALGRAAYPSVLQEDGFDFVAPSPIGLNDNATPRALTVPEIKEYVQLYAQAAKNAIQAGFDGVEIHGANGYLIDQFLQDVSNLRTDEYGGSIENRSRFGLEVAGAVVNAIGEDRTGIRLSPWNDFQKMKMADPIPQYTHFVTALKSAHPNLSYLHLVEPNGDAPANESNDFIRRIWAPKPLITASGYTRKSALARAAENANELIAFGRWYISNPDLPTRILEDIPFTPYNSKTFYVRGHLPNADVGYVDYPFADSVETPAQVRL